MRVLITGSRDWTDATVIYNALSSISIKEGEQVTVIHGGARGADYLAGQFANHLGYDVEVHKANWDTYGKRAGYIRNKEMVDSGADVCFAFIRNNSKGASMCAELARSAGIEVKTWRLDDA